MIVWNSDVQKLAGKTVIITGANSGIGYEAALAIAHGGARVVMACRNLNKANEAAGRIRERVPAADLQVMTLDLSNLASVREFATACTTNLDEIDVLINNAGVMALPHTLTTDGFEMQFGTNHLGHFALTGLLLPKLVARPGTRVVVVSSTVHTFGRMRFKDLDRETGYSKWAAYCQSKLANLLFAYELDRRLSGAGASTITVSCHPGYAATNIQSVVGRRLERSSIWTFFMSLGNRTLAQSAQRGAWPTVYACTSEEVQGGDFIGPAFHLWGKPVKTTTRAHAREPKAAAQLWEASVERTGVDYGVLGSSRSGV